MTFLIDTNIAIYAGAKNASVLRKFTEHAGNIAMSSLTLVEFRRGIATHAQDRTVYEAQLDVLLQQFPVLAFDRLAADAYGLIIAQLGWSRPRDFDRMIAAHAISTQSILVTNNEADFRDVTGLEIENWAA